MTHDHTAGFPPQVTGGSLECSLHEGDEFFEGSILEGSQSLEKTMGKDTASSRLQSIFGIVPPELAFEEVLSFLVPGEAETSMDTAILTSEGPSFCFRVDGDDSWDTHHQIMLQDRLLAQSSKDSVELDFMPSLFCEEPSLQLRSSSAPNIEDDSGMWGPPGLNGISQRLSASASHSESNEWTSSRNRNPSQIPGSLASRLAQVVQQLEEKKTVSVADCSPLPQAEHSSHAHGDLSSLPRFHDHDKATAGTEVDRHGDSITSSLWMKEGRDKSEAVRFTTPWVAVKAEAVAELQGLVVQSKCLMNTSSDTYRLGDWALTRVVQQHVFRKGRKRRATSGCSVVYHLHPSIPFSPQLSKGMLPPAPVDPSFRKRVKEKLLALAVAHASGETEKAAVLFKQLKKVANPRGNAVQKLASYLLLAIEARWEPSSSPAEAMSCVFAPLHSIDWSQVDLSEMITRLCSFMFGEVAFMESTIRSLLGSPKVHIIIFQKPLMSAALFQALANQAEVPQVRVTVVSLRIEGVPCGGELPASFKEDMEGAAARFGLELDVCVVEVPAVNFSTDAVRTAKDEAVAVLSAGLMMVPDGSVLKHNPRDRVLKWIHSLNPRCFILVDFDANFNEPFVIPRVKEALSRMSAVLEAYESTLPVGLPCREILEVGCALAVVNGVACDGLSQFWRSERAEQWVDRLNRLGFKTAPFPKGTWKAFCQISAMDSKVKVARDGEVARLQWAGTPFMFAMSLVP